MSVLKIGDKVRVKRGAYNIADHRFGMDGTVTRIDSESKLLPVRIEYDSFCFNWTNYESLELVASAPSQNAEIGKDILDKMQELKASIVARDAAIELVEQQTTTLDALLASVGLKRGEEVLTTPPAPVVRTALEDYKAGTVEEGFQYCLIKDRLSAYLTNGRVYTVASLDMDDSGAPIAFKDNDGDDYWAASSHLQYFIRVA